MSLIIVKMNKIKIKINKYYEFYGILSIWRKNHLILCITNLQTAIVFRIFFQI